MMKKVLYIGNMQDCSYPVFVKVILTKDGKLSMHGVEGPLNSGNCKGSAGQIQDHIKDVRLEGDLSKEQIDELHSIWLAWHLNDMTAGSPAQEDFLRLNPVDNTNHYENALIALKATGLSPDPSYIHEGKPYEYGSAWLKVELPASVVAFLESLPSTSRSYNWV